MQSSLANATEMTAWLRVFASDLRRAIQTADLAFAGSGISVFLDWRLRECNYGTLSGAPTDEVAQLRPSRIDQPFPSGQSYRGVVENTRSFLDDLRRDFAGQRVCVIAHTANKWALDVLLLGARLEDLLVADFGWREGWEYTVE